MPLPAYPPFRVQAAAGAGVGLHFPPRQSDCSGVRPSWWAFTHNVCDLDAPDPIPFVARELRLPPPPPPSILEPVP